MTKCTYTVWALLLHCMGKSLFKMCFVDALEDEYGKSLPFGPPMTSFIFAFGVYTITCGLDFYPKTLRKLSPFMMGLYEFLVTSFILEFSLACLWAPIDVHIYVTLTLIIRKALIYFEYNNAAAWMLQNKYPMTILVYIIAIGFFLNALYVTRLTDKLADIIKVNFTPMFYNNYFKRGIKQNLPNEYSNFDESENDDSINQRKGRNRRRGRKPLNTL